MRREILHMPLSHLRHSLPRPARAARWPHRWPAVPPRWHGTPPAAKPRSCERHLPVSQHLPPARKRRGPSIFSRRGSCKLLTILGMYHLRSLQSCLVSRSFPPCAEPTIQFIRIYRRLPKLGRPPETDRTLRFLG